MGVQYSSFLVRCWRRNDNLQRVEVEHLQSGERIRLVSLGPAVEWIDARLDAPGVDLIKAETETVSGRFSEGTH